MFFNRCLEEVFYVLCSGSSMGGSSFVTSLYGCLIKGALKTRKFQIFLINTENEYLEKVKFKNKQA